MPYLNVSNNASTQLTSDVGDSDTSITLGAGEGDQFPSSNFRITIWNADVYDNPADDNSMEIIHVGNRNGDTLTSLQRGVESTTASTHSTGHTLANLFTAGVLEDSTVGIKAGLHEKTFSLSELTDTGTLAYKDAVIITDVNTQTSTDGTVLTSNGDGSASWLAQTTLTTEQVQDIVGGLVVGGTSITVDYDDVANTLTINNAFTTIYSSDITSGAATSSQVLLADGSGNVSWGDQTTLTTEQVEDIVGGLVTGGTNITVTYNDSTNTITIDNTFTTVSDSDIASGAATSGQVLLADGSGNASWGNQTTLTDEQVEDIVGGFVVGGTNVTVTYDDSLGELTIDNDIDVYDSAVDGAVYNPVSSNWAYDHTNASDSHHVQYTDADARIVIEDYTDKISNVVYYLSVM